MAENNNSLLAGIISIHAPPRGATLTDGREAETPRFQFTPLREGRHAPERRGGTQLPDFNSRPSARGDPPRHGRRHADLISIHAPPRGATCNAAVRELATIYFNSRPSARGDPALVEAGVAVRAISIHAPPRGATDEWLARRNRLHHFNSRPSARGDHYDTLQVTILSTFQFTPLREGRQGNHHEVCLPAHFNSRPSARGDESWDEMLEDTDISIHAPPRGATAVPAPEGLAPQFQFTPLREGRRLFTRFRAAIDRISIHAPPRGATPFHPVSRGD